MKTRAILALIAATCVITTWLLGVVTYILTLCGTLQGIGWIVLLAISAVMDAKAEKFTPPQST
jgi:hypothetical protein